MESNLDKIRELRNLAILSKSNLQFGLTSLLLRLEYGISEEETKTNDSTQEFML